MIAAVNCAVDDYTALEADRSMYSLRFGKRGALDGWIGRIWPGREILRAGVDVKLAITAPRRRRWDRHAWLFIPFINFLSRSRHYPFLSLPW
jgi:hypothetical protein